MPRLIFSFEERATIAKEYAEGATLNELSAKYGGHVTTISRLIVRAGGTLRDRGGVYSQKKPTPRQQALAERNKKWREEYEAGSTLQQIADRYDFVNLTAIRNGIVKVGGTMRPTGYRKGEKNKNKPQRGLVGWVNS